MWLAVTECDSLAAAIARLLNEFDVGEATLVRDLDVFLRELSGRDLIATEIVRADR